MKSRVVLLMDFGSKERKALVWINAKRDQRKGVTLFGSIERSRSVVVQEKRAPT